MKQKFVPAWIRVAACVIVFAVSASPVFAQTDEPEFNTSSATVRIIKNSLATRHLQLLEHFQSGAIGLTHDGQVAFREPFVLDKAARTELDMLLAEDNKDRATLYREMARSNGRPDWEGPWRTAFAERWISRAPSGWYYRESGGRWVKKP